MSEPTNPIFEEEKDFLERKKLEYERALRGDVAHIKEQTVNVGKLALAGAGVAGGIWLLSKLFGGKKKPKRKPRPESDDYGDYPDDYSDYRDTPFYDEQDDHAGEPHDWPGPDAYYDDEEGFSERPGTAEGSVYHSDSGYEMDEDFDGTAPPVAEPETTATAVGADDNSDTDDRLDEFSDLPKPSAGSPGSSLAPSDLPYDDSRRLAHSESFDEEPQPQSDSRGKSAVKLAGKALMSFLQTDTGRVVLAQAAAVGMALVTKAVKGALPSEDAKPAKTTDLATPTVAAGAKAPPQPATRPVLHSPVPDASALDPDDATRRPSEPLT